MGYLFHRSYARGWVPSADEVNGPKDGLLRGDNLHLDEEGILALRRGSAKLNALAYADLDCHSLYTTNVAGTRYRMVGAGSRVYINDVAQPSSFDGSGDIPFESWLSFLFAARGTTKKKYQAGSEYNWGIKGPNQRPTVTAINPFTAVIASCNQAEAPAFVATEGTITATFPIGSDGVANGSIEVTPASSTGRSTITKTFASDQNFFDIAGIPGDDQDLFDMMAWIVEPEKVETITVMLGMGTGTDPFQDDYYYFDFKLGGARQSVVDLTDQETIQKIAKRKKHRDPDDGIVSINLPDAPVKFDEDLPVETRIQRSQDQRRRERKDQAQNPGWTHLSCLRAQFNRVGSTATKTWKTIRAIKLIYKAIPGSTGKVRYDLVLMIGGGGFRALTGTFQFRWALAKQFGTAPNLTDGMLELSPASPFSDLIDLVGQGVQMTIPRSALNEADIQADKIWVYFFGGFMDTWYLALQAGVLPLKMGNGQYGWGIDEFVPIPPASGFTMTDLTRIVTQGFGIPSAPSTADLVIDVIANDVLSMIANEVLVEDLTPPPDNIIDVEGPHHDRMFVLSQEANKHAYLYVSERRRPGAYSIRRVFDVGDATETAYWLARTTGAIYVGTSEDIYAIFGQGEENPDDTINFEKRPLNLGSPPADQFVAVEGNKLIYRAADGFRAIDGIESVVVPRADVDLLWKGYTRHGVLPPNRATGRFRGVLSNSILTAIVPEGASTDRSQVLHRYDFQRDKWYRHPYTPNFRSIHREPDGTVVAGDDAGFVRQLDVGTLDDGALIPVIAYTPVDDNGRPLHRKDPYDTNLKLDTGGASCTVDLHLNGSAAPALSYVASAAGMGIHKRDVSAIGDFRQIQARLSGNFATFKLYEWALDYRLRPQTRMFADTGYLPIGKEDDLTWVREIIILANSAANLSVGIYFDGVLLTTKSVVVQANVMRPYSIPLGRNVRGRQGRITISTVSAPGTGEVGFEVVWVKWRHRGSGLMTQKTFPVVVPELVAAP